MKVMPGRVPTGYASEELGDGDASPDVRPHRESAKGILERHVAALEMNLAGLKHMLKIASALEVGSPGEEVLWRLLASNHTFLRG